MNRARTIVGIVIGLALSAAPAQAAGQWRLSQPAAPEPPVGVTAPPFPVPLGAIGDLQFQAPNRALLATAGSGADGTGQDGLVKEGLYRWDGARWTPFSSVCSAGGGGARIVWAGPREFWTIAYQAAAARGTDATPRTLCHFVDGAVVASFATPISDANPYLDMTGGACNGPNDCWFGGSAYEAKPGTFHLHWDGTQMRVVVGPQGRPVRDMAAFRGKVYEVTTISGDTDEPRTIGPAETEPHLIHSLSTNGDGVTTIATDPFVPADYPDGANPDEIDPDTEDFYPLVSDEAEFDSLDAANDDVLWAGGGQTTTGPNLGDIEPRFSRGPVLAAKVQDAPFKEVPLTDPRLDRRALTIVDIAALPDRTAWLAIRDNEAPKGAVVAHVDLTGKVLDYAVLPTADDPDPNTIGSQTGTAAKIDCSGIDDCWLATSSGWLYRLGTGVGLTVDDDPYFNTFIAVRPADATSVADTSDEIPVDNSGADLPPLLPQYLTVPDPTPAPVVTPPRAKNVKVKAVGRTRIVISFTLTKQAKVKIKLLHGKAVVAQSPRRVLAPGKKSFTFPVSPRRWPTGIKLDVAQP